MKQKNLLKITKYNLGRDKKVLGKEWFTTYGGWFSDEENAKRFTKAVKHYIQNKNPDILYVASASGWLGEKLLADLGGGTLTIVDISEKHLNENKNPNTKKIRADLLKLNLKKKFDVIMMRSSLDYFPSAPLQIKVLKIIKNHLKSNGIFVNQPAYIPNKRSRDIISAIYNSINKIGKRFFQSADLKEIYYKAGFKKPQKIGESKVMRITEKDHRGRYGLTSKEIKKIQERIGNSPSHARITKEGYMLTFEFPIFISKLTKIK